ncbi:response regulator [Rhizobium tubonense]|uniref:Response regulatory domain-containing protein n=1 Tax=Rhizobium tubonense TaxID=484088 RepID=A0A2W4CWP6_9HYPH|nr:response regulator [Rhizobium tubonense]PZM14645.1 hypothetical protein CPY51_10165 [Rhizobium tubonense]
MTKQRAIRILIVEDEALVAMLLEDLLTEMGHEVVGPAFRIDEALKLARQAELDIAILDVNLSGNQSFPVADILRQRNIPFMFATGYGAEGFRDGYRNEVTLRKPYELGDLERAIATVLSSHC